MERECISIRVSEQPRDASELRLDSEALLIEHGLDSYTEEIFAMRNAKKVARHEMKAA